VFVIPATRRRARCRVGASLHRFEVTRHHDRRKRSRCRAARPESACGHGEILCGKHEVHHPQTVGGCRLVTLHATTESSPNARSDLGTFRRGTELASELRSTSWLRTNIYSKTPFCNRYGKLLAYFLMHRFFLGLMRAPPSFLNWISGVGVLILKVCLPRHQSLRQRSSIHRLLMFRGFTAYPGNRVFRSSLNGK
jgi:hypothetical protein